MADHCGYGTNKVTDQSRGENFNSPGHYFSDMEVAVRENKKKLNIERKGRSIL